MAKESKTKLTRYTSAETVITSDVMNKVFGGNYGFDDNADEYDPSVAGHIHDGEHADGHASKILLTDGKHVRGFLSGDNLGGSGGSSIPAVRYLNIRCYSSNTYGTPHARRVAAQTAGTDLEIMAIPEFIEGDGGDRCYYLDLSNSAGGSDGSVQFNKMGSFGGSNDLFYDYEDSLLGVGTATPARRLHVSDGANPPVRIEGLSSGSGSVVVVDGNGDLFFDSSIGNKNLFDKIEMQANGALGQHVGDYLLEADVPSDTLIVEAGDGIILTGDHTADKMTISVFTGSSGDVLTTDQNGSLSWEPVNVSTQSLSQWTGTGDWIQKAGGPDGFYSSVFSYSPSNAGRDIASRVLIDSSLTFYLNTGVPLNGDLSAGVGGSIPGGHNGLPSYIDPVSGPDDIPSECRLTAYFLLNNGIPGNSISNMNVRLFYGSATDPSVSSGEMTDFSDGELIFKDNWNYKHYSSDTFLDNSHNYPSAQDGMVVVSDFSGLKITTDKINAGLYSFKIVVDIGSNLPSNYWDNQDPHLNLGLIGARLLWIWDDQGGQQQNQQGNNAPAPMMQMSNNANAQPINDGANVDQGVVVKLDASGTTDLDGDQMLFDWTYVYDSEQFTIELLSTDSQKTFDTSAINGSVVFRVQPFDGTEYGQYVERTINVFNNQAPSITILGDNPMNLAYKQSFSDPGATANDAEDGDLTGSIVTTGSVNPNVSGTYSINYEVTDSNGTVTSDSRTVIVAANQAPTITLLGDAVVNLDYKQSFSDPGATASDPEDGDLTGSIIVTGSVNPNVSGTYTLNYNVSDLDGLPAAEVSRTVNVAANQAPTITLNGSSTMSINQGDQFSDPGATASDPEDGDLTANIVITGSVNENAPGSYTLNYNVSDLDGLAAAQVSRTVNVQAVNQAPTAVITGDANGTVGVAVNLSGSSSTDPENDALSYNWSFSVVPNGSSLTSENIVDTQNTSFTPDVSGTYAVTLQVNDGSLNSAVVGREIPVSSNQSPVVDMRSVDWSAQGGPPPGQDNWPQISELNNPGQYNAPDVPFGNLVGFYAGKSTDIEDTGGNADDANANAELSYTWIITEAPAQSAYSGLLGNPNPPVSGANPEVNYSSIGNSRLEIKPDFVGSYTVKVEVEDSSANVTSFVVRFKIAG